MQLAERVGFEPRLRLTAQRLSRPWSKLKSVLVAGSILGGCRPRDADVPRGLDALSRSPGWVRTAFPRPTISGTVACRLRAALADVVEMVDTQDLKS